MGDVMGEHDLSFPPSSLLGDEGEVVFIRRDLAQTVTQARAWAMAHEGMTLRGFDDVDEVEMLPVPDHFIGIEYDWAMVKTGTPGAVAYWRFR